MLYIQYGTNAALLTRLFFGKLLLCLFIISFIGMCHNLPPLSLGRNPPSSFLNSHIPNMSYYLVFPSTFRSSPRSIPNWFSVYHHYRPFSLHAFQMSVPSYSLCFYGPSPFSMLSTSKCISLRISWPYTLLGPHIRLTIFLSYTFKRSSSAVVRTI